MHNIFVCSFQISFGTDVIPHLLDYFSVTYYMFIFYNSRIKNIILNKVYYIFLSLHYTFWRVKFNSNIQKKEKGKVYQNRSSGNFQFTFHCLVNLSQPAKARPGMKPSQDQRCLSNNLINAVCHWGVETIYYTALLW